ncbi:hypothetical protein CHS0354_021846 [Potamilus streckersoni]|uniref:Claudin n=1 Tax=Potamilus streckersoni TaxID=2493646 RepID=A0AAE0TF96_9BIVA|nr:hypothetical protein CHS0354_021846 [Potamilus streckersoni]
MNGINVTIQTYIKARWNPPALDDTVTCARKRFKQKKLRCMAVKKLCMMVKLSHVALGCTGASMVICLNAIALPYWFYAKKSSQEGMSIIYHGLWTTCHEFEARDQAKYLNCNTIARNRGSSYIATTRRLELTGLILVSIAAITGSYGLVAFTRNTAVQFIAGGVAVTAGNFMFVGAIIFAEKTKGLEAKGATLHVGFVFAILAGVLAVIGGSLFVAGRSD